MLHPWAGVQLLFHPFSDAFGMVLLMHLTTVLLERAHDARIKTPLFSLISGKQPLQHP